MKRKNSMFRIAGLLLIGSFFLVGNAFADIRLSVVPVDGGNTLRFGRVDTLASEDKEVLLRITSTGGQQYQIYQRLAEPLVNERGVALERSVIMASTLPGSNVSGSVYLQGLERLHFADQLIYTSDQNGTSDTLTILYKVNPEEMTASGNFLGNIVFTARPIGGGAQDQVVLNLFLQDSGDLEVKTETSSGRDTIQLSSARPDEENGYFQISLTGNRGHRISVYQELLAFPANEMRQFLEEDMVQFSVDGKEGQGRYPTPGNIPRNQELVYETTAGDDALTVHFRTNADALSLQTAGVYQGKIRYIVDIDGEQRSYDANLVVNVAPVFKLLVEYPPGGVSFKRLLPNSPPEIREVVMKVQTNLGRPYMVNQTVSAALTNEKGEELSSEYFTIQQELVAGEGKVRFSEFTPVPVGDTPLYHSDLNGRPAEIRVRYRINPQHSETAGDFKTMILYSLGEI